MVLEKILNAFSRKTDQQLVSFFSEVQKDKGQIVRNVNKENEQIPLYEDIAHVVNFNVPGKHVLIMPSSLGLMVKTGWFKKGTYIIRPTVEEISAGGISIEGNVIAPEYQHKIIIAPLASRTSYDEAFRILTRLPLIETEAETYRAAAELKKKRDALPEDRQDYYCEIFIPQKNRLWPKALAAGIIGLFGAMGVKAYVDYRFEEERKRKEYVATETQKILKDREERRLIDNQLAEAKKEQEKARKDLDGRLKLNEDRIKNEKARLAELKIEQNLETLLKEKYGINCKINYIPDESFRFEAEQPELRSLVFIETAYKDRTYNLYIHLHTKLNKEMWKLKCQRGETTAIETQWTADYSTGSLKTIVSFDNSGEINSDCKEVPPEIQKHTKEFAKEYNLPKLKREIIDELIKILPHHFADKYIGKE